MYLGGGVGKAAVRFGGFKGHTGKTPRENNIFYIILKCCITIGLFNWNIFNMF